MSGAGNIFSVLDNRNYNIDATVFSKYIIQFCKIGEFKTEGLVVLDNNHNGLDFSVQYFNPDGTQGMMCGNGGRCAVLFAADKKIRNEFSHSSEFTFSMAGSIYQAQFTKNGVRLYFPPPIEIKTNIKIDVYDKFLFCDYINNGADHIVIAKNSVESLKSIELNDIILDDFAKPIRHHKLFQPKGTNVNLYEQISKNELQLRTFERGVEAETGACGTGAIATFLSALSKGKVTAPVHILTRSSNLLTLDILGLYPSNIKKVILEGPAEYIKNIEIEIPDLN